MRAIDIFGHENVYALTAEQSAAWDGAAREQHGVPERLLMENAGRAVAGVLQALHPRGRVLAAVGSGHNGGDALVALRVLREWGRDVEWLSPDQRTPDLDVLHGQELPRASIERLDSALLSANVIVDGLLGTGARGAPRGKVASVIESINAARRPVIAVDLPSGVDATTGRIEGVAVRARATVSFGGAKIGLLLHPARAHCGRLLVAEIGFPLLQDRSVAQLLTPAWAHGRLPRRPPDTHKGVSGRILLLAGSCGMAGAAAMAGRGALSAGAGLVRIVSSAENRTILQTLLPEATFFDRAGEWSGEGIHALVAGCGLSTQESALEAFEHALDVTDTLPAILDADALNLLAERPELLVRISARRPLVLTPHVREFARISRVPEADILCDPVGRARDFALATGATVLLKGQPSLVAAPDQPVLIGTTGSSDLATGGTGDWLAGVVGAFLAAGAAPRDAAGLALFYGGRAADLARRGRSLSPQDLAACLPKAFRAPGARTCALGLPFIIFDQPDRW